MNSNPAPRRQTLSERKQDSILRAAADEFRQAGFEATSMDRIAAAAGVSKRTVYNHFPSKEALFAAVLRQLWSRAESASDVQFDASRPLDGQLAELLAAKLALLREPSFIELARVAIAESIHSPGRAKAIFERLGNQEEGLLSWVRAAAASGKLRIDDAEFAAQQLQALIKGFAFWPQISLGQPALSKAKEKRLISSAVSMFLRCYAVE
ncbi:TetR/AcrR family transcriptional regulator [Pseudoxanthomonas dokdonensis]|uniref:TetR family transcriptional regulator n=1 Tax=Pseudoxanthomonas dokdonensis TaxID=344882 RepID=A0A0R0CPN4_9GAMM|nr:TetR/AcrR family transcriptional regulator [Pseudoxanthomonas dokdonensis]KRG68186.1 TetR family transcriptional regulator [Pseudoxanthomonas dokdonensis]